MRCLNAPFPVSGDLAASMLQARAALALPAATEPVDAARGEPPEPGPAIEVERLAEAIAALDLRLPHDDEASRSLWRTDAAQLKHAAAILAEYERLSE